MGRYISEKTNIPVCSRSAPILFLKIIPKKRFARLPQGTQKCWVTEIIGNSSTFGTYHTIF